MKRLSKQAVIAELESMKVTQLFGRPLNTIHRKTLVDAWDAFLQGAPKHLSHSQVSMFQRCARQYKYRYMDKLVRPPGWSLTLGGSVDVAQNYAYNALIESGKVEPLDAIEDAYREEFKMREDETVFEDTSPDAVFDKGRSVLRVFHDEVVPKKEPLEVQSKCEVYLTDVPYFFVGYIDLVAVEGKEQVIIDNKCTGRKFPDSRVVSDNQLTAYAAIYQAVKGSEFLPLVGYDLLVHTKEPKAVQQRGVRTTHDIARYFAKVNETWELIKNGYFPAHSGESWECSERFCGYWGICHEEYA